LLVISTAATAKIIEEAQRAYPHEGCGMLVGRREGDDYVVTEAPTATNENSDRPKVWYDLSPADQLRVSKEAQKRGLDVIGFYHSHPDHPAAPSEGDRSRAFGSLVYVIASVEKAKYKVMTAWALDDDTAFPEHTAKFTRVEIKEGRA
jgi:proteasome lid subunit RPN8/RPN11